MSSGVIAFNSHLLSSPYPLRACANVTLTQLGGGETCEGQFLQGESKVTSSVVTTLHLQTFLKHCHFVPTSRKQAKIATWQSMAAFPFSQEKMGLEISMTCQRSPAEHRRRDLTTDPGSRDARHYHHHHPDTNYNPNSSGWVPGRHGPDHIFNVSKEPQWRRTSHSGEPWAERR